MKAEQMLLAAQLLSAMKDASKKLESAAKKNDSDNVAVIKKEILDLQKKLGEIL